MPRTSPRLFPILLSVADASRALGVDRARLYAAIRAGHLALFRDGVKKRILVADLVEWVRHHWTRESLQ